MFYTYTALYIVYTPSTFIGSWVLLVMLYTYTYTLFILQVLNT